MYGYIYITENLINNKKYIGQHKCDHFDFEQYKGSGIRLQRAFKKYGKDNFVCKLLPAVPEMPTICESRDQLNEAEIFYIDLYDCIHNPEFYNLATGGGGGNLGEIALQHLSQATKGKNTWTKGRICIHKNSVKKKVKAEDLQEYLDNGWELGLKPKRIKVVHPRVAHPAWNKGLRIEEWATPDHINKLREAARKPKSEEHKQKISQVRKEKGLAKGEKNPMYGKGYLISGERSRSAKKVRCIETDITYISTVAASKATGIRAGGIQDAARGLQHTAGGFHWEYIINNDNNKIDSLE